MQMKLFIICLVCCVQCMAQDVTGSWFGIGKVNTNNNDGNGYLTEMVLVQKGKNVSGTFSYYFRDSLFTNNIVGSFDVASRTLSIKPTKLIYHKANNAATGVDCPVQAYFTLRVARTESVLTGSFFAEDNYKYTCPPVQFKLKKFIEQKAVESIDSTEEQTNQEPVKDTVKTLPITTTTPEEKEKDKVFTARTKTFTKEITVTSNSLRLEFYDNGAIDNDSISVYFNNKLIVNKARLEHKAIEATVVLDDSLPYNEISMFAESLGLIPPNTALLVVYDGTKRFDILITSDFSKNGTIKINRAAK